MAIEKSSLTPGTRLVARYKQQTYVCTVEQGEGGRLAFVLEDGRRCTSPSAAGTAVMGGTIACNGLRFWSLEGALKSPRSAAVRTADAPTAEPKLKQPRGGKALGLFKRLKSQDGVPEGQTRWFCSGCMDSFDAPTGESPSACPQGHTDQPVAQPAS